MVNERVGLVVVNSFSIKNFVRKAPLYQQLPGRMTILSLCWRYISGVLYLIKQLSLTNRIHRQRLKRLKSMKNTYLRQNVLIIGNGPSANSINLSAVEYFKNQNSKIIAMNSYYKTKFANKITPDFYFMLDPEFENKDNKEFLEIKKYLISNPETTLVLSSLVKLDLSELKNVLFINGIQATGLWKNYSPVFPNTWPQGVLFNSLQLAKYLGFEIVYAFGIDNSFYLNHCHNQLGEIYVSSEGLHSYREDISKGLKMPTIKRITRNLSDVLYAHAIFLRELRHFSEKLCIINVGESDFTNDAFPFACLIHNKK